MCEGKRRGTIPWSGVKSPCKECEIKKPCGDRSICVHWREYRAKIDAQNEERRKDNDAYGYSRSVGDRLRKRGKIE